MSKKPTRLLQLPNLPEEAKLDRSLLKDMAAELLRDYVSSGIIPEGTKITEREVSQILNISRMPARDALIVLEQEGLVESRSNGRYVIELSEHDVYGIHKVRMVLEKLAVELAVANMNDRARVSLRDLIHALEEAVVAGDASICTKRDIAIHREIWRQANNPYLLRILESLLGLIFVLAARVKLYSTADVERLLREHSDLVSFVTSGDATGAVGSLQTQLETALKDSLRTFHAAERESATE